MTKTEARQNPLKSFSLPLGARAAAAAFIGISILLEYAPEMMSGFTGSSSHALLIVLLLIGFAIVDGIYAFRFGLRLPAKSLEVYGIESTYSSKEIQALMVSGKNPNEKYLSWIGRWAARASDRFSSLPVVYQRLFEIALTAIAFVVAILIVIVLLTAFGRAGGRPDISETIQSWLLALLILLIYVYWGAILKNIFTAASLGQVLSAGRIVKITGILLMLIVLLSFVTQIFAVQLPPAPSLQPWATISIIGSVAIILSIIAMVWLRSSGDNFEMECSRIQLSDSAAVHPHSVMNALRSFLSQSKAGIYSEIGEDNKVILQEQRNMPGGTFNGVFVGEYGRTLKQVGSSRAIRIFASVLGIISITVVTGAYVVLWYAAYEPSYTYWLTYFALTLFGQLGFILAYFPLSETVWESYLISMRMQGNYQSRGSMTISSSEHTPGYGSFFIDYTLDGGICKTYSVSYPPASAVKADAKRVIMKAFRDNSEKEEALQALRIHLMRAAGGSDS